MKTGELKRQILGLLLSEIQGLKLGFEDNMTLADMRRLDAAKGQLMAEFGRRTADHSHGSPAEAPAILSHPPF
jgi:hypothetical protein